MVTYGIIMCPHCFGHGIVLTIEETLSLHNAYTASDPKTALKRIQIKRKLKDVLRCKWCEGAGWIFSRDAKRSILPEGSYKRW